MLYNRYTITKHGFVFKVNQTRYGHMITLDGKWLWRSRTKKEATDICQILSLKYLRGDE